MKIFFMILSIALTVTAKAHGPETEFPLYIYCSAENASSPVFIDHHLFVYNNGDLGNRSKYGLVKGKYYRATGSKTNTSVWIPSARGVSTLSESPVGNQFVVSAIAYSSDEEAILPAFVTSVDVKLEGSRNFDGWSHMTDIVNAGAGYIPNRNLSQVKCEQLNKNIAFKKLRLDGNNETKRVLK